MEAWVIFSFVDLPKQLKSFFSAKKKTLELEITLSRLFHFRFALDDNLYYLSAVEWAASAMEMSAISGKNVANMIASKWKKASVTADKIQGSIREEL